MLILTNRRDQAGDVWQLSAPLWAQIEHLDASRRSSFENLCDSNLPIRCQLASSLGVAADQDW
jgi:hypothetical protein